jgi:serine/threonine protein kinase
MTGRAHHDGGGGDSLVKATLVSSSLIHHLRFAPEARDAVGMRLRPRAAAFYAVQLVQALDALHCSHVLYRSLAPSAVLLDGKGHAVLGGFAMARRLPGGGRAYTLCAGAMGYLAPEQLTGSGYGRGVDVWALGVWLCEQLTGVHPFDAALGPTLGDGGGGEVEEEGEGRLAAADMDRAFRRIVTASLEQGPALQQLPRAGGGSPGGGGPGGGGTREPHVLSLLRQLLHPDPQQRLGFVGRTAGIVQHPWFGSVLGGGDVLQAVWERRPPPPLRVPAHMRKRAPTPGTGAAGAFPFF